MGDHGQGGTEPQALGNLDDLEDFNTFSIVDDAFERAELPDPLVETSPFGARPLDLFVAGGRESVREESDRAVKML